MKKSFFRVFAVATLLVVLGMSQFLTAFAAEVWLSKDHRDFGYAEHKLGTENKGKVVVEFDATPLEDAQDTCIAYYDTSNFPSSHADVNVLIRFAPNGIIDVRNGDAYEKLTDVTYSANKKVHIKAVIDVDAAQYDVWVDNVQIAADYAFRTSAMAMDDVGKVAIVTVNTDDKLKVENHVIYPFGSSPATAASASASANPKTGDSGMIPFAVAGLGSVIVLVSARKRKQ